MSNLPDKDGFYLIYDFINQMPNILLPLVFFGVSIFSYYSIKRTIKSKDDSVKDHLGISEYSKKIVLSFIGMVVGIIAGLYTLGLGDYFKERKIYHSNSAKTTEGYVSGLIFTHEKKDIVEFTINGVHFTFGQVLFGVDCSYSDIMCFDLKDSTYMKIKYFLKDNEVKALKVMTK
jgi:ABC-type microcin C transport system permease subunit YejB